MAGSHMDLLFLGFVLFISQARAIGLHNQQFRLQKLSENGYNAHHTWDDLRMAPSASETIKAEFVKLPIDHFGGAEGTFENRFWVAEAGYRRGGPVFIYDGGEGDASPFAVRELQSNASFFKQIVDEFGGIGIVWEHRYYGASLPYNVSLDTPATEMQYLTTEQALADVPYFAANFTRRNLPPNIDLTPSSTPWIFIGGSYPGMRAAFMRNIYPSTIYASYASSAPVEARIDMSVYFEQVYRGMNAYGFGNCTQDIHAAINYIDDQLSSPASAAALKIAFFGRNADGNSNGAFADALTTIFYNWQGYGVEGGYQGLRAFCDWIGTDPATNATSGAAGWSRSKGARYTVHRWLSWPPMVLLANEYLFSDCEGPVTGNASTSAPTCQLQERVPQPDGISWTWQYCTQWGFFQSANLGPTQIVSSYNSLQHQADICHAQFPDGLASGLLPAWPRVNETNAHFGGWTIRPSNVYWSGGEWDPWRTLSPLSTEPWAPDVRTIQQTPACDVSTDEATLYAYIMPDAEHSFDFRTTFPQGKVSRGFFTEGLWRWLKCFKGSGEREGGGGSVYGRGKGRRR